MVSEVRHAFRSLRKSPGFTVIVVATLALGIGANTAIFSIVNGFLLKALPYADADRIVNVYEMPPKFDRNVVSPLNYLDWKQENTVFEFMAATAGVGGSAVLTGVDDPVQLRGSKVSVDYFKVFGVRAALGRMFAANEDQPGNDHVVVISHAFWQSQFGGERSTRTVALLKEWGAVE